MAAQSPTDGCLPPWKKPGKQGKEVSRSEDEKKPTATKITESAKPILEEQALLREKLKNLPTWKKDKDAHLKRKTQPVFPTTVTSYLSAINIFLSSIHLCGLYDINSCTCTRPHCVHLLFVMLRVFKLKENDPLLWTQKLKNFEVEKLLSKFHARVKSRLQKDMNAQKTSRAKGQRSTPPTTPCTNSLGGLPQAREDEEVCPICLLEMVEGESLTSCQDGCHNRLHQHCMEILLTVTIFVFTRSPDHSIRSELPSVPAPLGPEEITLPHSNPVPAAQVELAKPWIEAFGENLVCCLFSREWNVRETALRRLSKDINTIFMEGSSSQNMTAFEACCSLLSMMCGDPVYRVYVAALKCLFDVIEAVLAKCADSNRRISALSIQVLLELCKDENGDLALGKMLGAEHVPQPLGGLNFILSCILRTAAEYSTWPWWLGRLMFLRKLMEEYVTEFELSDDCVSVQMDTAGVLVQGRGNNACEDPSEIYQSNVRRLMSVLKFTMQAANCSHSKVSKLAIAVLTCCMSLSYCVPSAQQHIKKVVSKLKPSQRSSLNRQLQAIPRASVTTVSRSDSVFTYESQTSMDPPSSTSSNRDSAIGSLPSAMSDDEADNFSESELLQAIVDNFERPQSLCLSPSFTFSPNEEVNLDWSRSLEDSPRMPPVKLAVGKKCQEIIAQEEAEAMAKAMAVSSLDSGPFRIPSLDSGDEMVIIFTQPESLEKAVNSKHLYLEGVHWKKGELLGTGAYSSCYAVRDLMNGSLMAVKQVSFCRNSVEDQTKVTQTIEDEISLLGRLQHPHLIKCLGATKHAGHFNIFLEWMAGGSITNLLKKYGPFDEKIVISYTRQILQGVGYLHQNQVIHRDIKGANILVDSTGKNIRIADFGAAARLATQLTGAGEFQGQSYVERAMDEAVMCGVWDVLS
ncbi:hypothetical protein pdam_00017438 [Pocillopora damicornis]|uniref:Protein kinase domain-containing protein n=1 Tax=Pocillopora damicornis TaxID=46731 RepID=A0A3M6U7M4_POCDA|nr:hypothetical protein pdam_00017438 [Pocillopora damicornis]